MCDARVLCAKEDAEKMLHGSGRVLLRRSGTEPKVRVMVEHPNEQVCEACVEMIAREIEKCK